MKNIILFFFSYVDKHFYIFYKDSLSQVMDMLWMETTPGQLSTFLVIFYFISTIANITLFILYICSICFFLSFCLAQWKQDQYFIFIFLFWSRGIVFAPSAFHKGFMIEWPSKFLVIFLLSATLGSADKTTQDDEYGILGSYISCDHID